MLKKIKRGDALNHPGKVSLWGGGSGAGKGVCVGGGGRLEYAVGLSQRQDGVRGLCEELSQVGETASVNAPRKEWACCV